MAEVVVACSIVALIVVIGLSVWSYMMLGCNHGTAQASRSYEWSMDSIRVEHGFHQSGEPRDGGASSSGTQIKSGCQRPSHLLGRTRSMNLVLAAWLAVQTWRPAVMLPKSCETKDCAIKGCSCNYLVALSTLTVQEYKQSPATHATV